MLHIQKTTMEFLSDIKQHNDKEWFIKNRDKYDKARNNYESFVQAVIDEISKFDPSLRGLGVKSCTYRFNRDIRFSNDKSIYKTNFGAFVIKGGKKFSDRYAGYYIHIEPGKNMIAGGAYMPPSQWLNAIREKISIDPNPLLKIINNKDFKNNFRNLDGDKLKTAPKGYPKDHPSIELLKYKSYLAVNEVSDKMVLSIDFFSHIMKVVKAMKPLNDFLNDYQ
jgi:uncharacterized protein (TIGR02453 family)